MTCLANNLLATLSSSQQSAITLALTEANATQYWSNLPTGFSTRKGISISAMSSTQAAAAETLLDAALSDAGEETMDQLRLADEYLSNNGGGSTYGGDLYYVSFLGTPSETSPWILELTGHHYTFLYSINGSSGLSLTPNFVGVEPVSFTSGGTSYTPMASEHDALKAVMDSLSSAQLSTAQLTSAVSDLVVGPQNDGNFPTTREGVLVSSLSSSQQALVKAAIEAYAGDAESTGQYDDYVTTAALADTYIAWSNYSDLATRGSYIRIDGPRVWIEFSVQSGVIFSANHYHSIWRDKTLDYGGNFTF